MSCVRTKRTDICVMSFIVFFYLTTLRAIVGVCFLGRIHFKKGFHWHSHDIVLSWMDFSCILYLTAAVSTKLADACSSDTVIASSPGK